ncbi:MAG: PEP-CTERM sorting domain-containing protein [Candidatus Methylacidiphilales bacterium]|nr:PEP-CTERM sorting domain-containing protein [Candidatus Methylacidiphilales bacterium]
MLGAVTLLVLLPFSSGAVTIYTQTFDNTSAANGGNANTSTVNWFGISNVGAASSAVNLSTSSVDPNSVTPLLSNAQGKDATAGLLAFNFAQNTSSTKRALIYTASSNFISGYSAAAFSSMNTASWWQGNTSNSPTTALAVQLGSDWYISDTTFTSPAIQFGSGFATGAEQKTVTFSTTTWTKLNFTLNTTGFTLGTGGDAGIAAASLGSLSVQGIGFFSTDTTGARMRYDSLVLDAAAIPEPGTYTLLAGGLLTLTFLRRRNPPAS